MPEQNPTALEIEQIINDILATIEREREREIISRRFGLFDRKETLEQIGELLGITRERVRQLEKSVITRLKATAEKDLPHINDVQSRFVSELEQTGGVSRVSLCHGGYARHGTCVGGGAGKQCASSCQRAPTVLHQTIRAGSVRGSKKVASSKARVIRTVTASPTSTG